eukprot:3760310-Alexandrium_andersonii.AAC.1
MGWLPDLYCRVPVACRLSPTIAACRKPAAVPRMVHVFGLLQVSVDGRRCRAMVATLATQLTCDAAFRSLRLQRSLGLHCLGCRIVSER